MEVKAGIHAKDPRSELSDPTQQKSEFLDVDRVSNRIITGLKMKLLEFRIRRRILFLVIKHYSPLSWIKILTTLDQSRRKYLGKSRIRKIAEIDQKFYWDLYIPAYPSQAFDEFFKAEMNRILLMEVKTNRFTNVIFAITKKCPLQCEHCFEWDALNKKELLTQGNIQHLFKTFEELGTAQIQISGGEPMMRLDDILETLTNSDSKTEYWLLSSGYNFTKDNAVKLKKAGLSGLVISIDHFNADIHDQFRRTKNSFMWAETAVKNAQAAGLVIALSICVTREFVTDANLMSYANMAKSLGVSFIQILEPKAVGHYKGKDVNLHEEHEKILENFYWKMNFEKSFEDYPIISYHGQYQRDSGCMASGNRALYIDTDGDILACPFCQAKMGSALSENVIDSLFKLQSKGCERYNSATI